MLQLVLPRIQAWELLHNPEYSGSLNMVDFEELLIKAGYSRRVAHKAAMQRGWDRLIANVKV